MQTAIRVNPCNLWQEIIGGTPTSAGKTNPALNLKIYFAFILKIILFS